MSNVDYRPRLSVEITPEQQRLLQKHLDFGMQKKLFAIVIDDLLKMMELHGRNFLAAIIMHRISYQDITSLEIGGKEVDTKPIKGEKKKK